MSTPPEKPKVRINPLLLEDDEYPIARGPSKPQPKADAPPPRALPDWVTAAAQASEQTRVSATEEPPAPPRWPMFSGILTFPFYSTTLGAWTFISIGLTITGWLAMFWWAYGAVLGATSARLLGMPTLLAGTLTLAYAASCCLAIIEATSNGADVCEISPGVEWKEWIWNLFHVTALALQAGVVGFAVRWAGFADSPWPAAAGTLAAFPFVLLGALAADGAWVPVAILTVLRSLAQVWWAWGLFFIETSVMIVGWTFLTMAGLHSETPWLMPLYSAPLLAAVILIYARLLGRLAGCIAASTEFLIEGDENEDEEG